jgi:hypothetical protein
MGLIKTIVLGQEWCFMLVIPALKRQRQDNSEFKTNLGYIARPYHGAY